METPIGTTIAAMRPPKLRAQSFPLGSHVTSELDELEHTLHPYRLLLGSKGREEGTVWMPEALEMASLQVTDRLGQHFVSA